MEWIFQLSKNCSYIQLNIVFGMITRHVLFAWNDENFDFTKFKFSTNFMILSSSVTTTTVNNICTSIETSEIKAPLFLSCSISVSLQDKYCIFNFRDIVKISVSGFQQIFGFGASHTFPENYTICVILFYSVITWRLLLQFQKTANLIVWPLDYLIPQFLEIAKLICILLNFFVRLFGDNFC